MPFSLVENMSMIRVYNRHNLRRVCFSCWGFRGSFSTKNLMNREVGQRKIDKKLVKSVTRQEMYDWFEGFHRYRNRPDIEDCLMPYKSIVLGAKLTLD